MPPAPYPPPRSQHLYNPLSTTLPTNSQPNKSPNLINNKNEEERDEEDDAMEVENSLVRSSQSQSDHSNSLASKQVKNVSNNSTGVRQLTAKKNKKVHATTNNQSNHQSRNVELDGSSAQLLPAVAIPQQLKPQTSNLNSEPSRLPPLLPPLHPPPPFSRSIISPLSISTSTSVKRKLSPEIESELRFPVASTSQLPDYSSTNPVSALPTHSPSSTSNSISIRVSTSPSIECSPSNFTEVATPPPNRNQFLGGSRWRIVHRKSGSYIRPLKPLWKRATKAGRQLRDKMTREATERAAREDSIEESITETSVLSSPPMARKSGSKPVIREVIQSDSNVDGESEISGEGESENEVSKSCETLNEVSISSRSASTIVTSSTTTNGDNSYSKPDEFQVIPHPLDPEYIPYQASSRVFTTSIEISRGLAIPKSSESNLSPKVKSNLGISKKTSGNSSNKFCNPVSAYVVTPRERGSISKPIVSSGDDSDEQIIILSSRKKQRSKKIFREDSASVSINGSEMMDEGVEEAVVRTLLEKGKRKEIAVPVLEEQAKEEYLSRKILMKEDAEGALSTSIHDHIYQINIDSVQIPTTDISKNIWDAGHISLKLVLSLSIGDDVEDTLNEIQHEIPDSSIIIAYFDITPSDSNLLTTLLPQKPLFCDLEFSPTLSSNSSITDLFFVIKVCFPEAGDVFTSTTTFATIPTTTRVVSSGRFMSSPSSSILSPFLDNDLFNDAQPGINLRWSKSLVNLSLVQEEGEFLRRFQELMLKDTKVWLPDGVKLEREDGWSTRSLDLNSKKKKKRTKVVDLGPFRRTYSTLTREPEKPGRLSRWEDDDNVKSSAALIRETDQILSTLQISAPYLSEFESTIVTRLHSRFSRINIYPRSLVERETSTWSYYAPVLLHHFHASKDLYPQFTTVKRVKLSIGYFLRSFTKCNLLSQVEYGEIMKSFSERVDSIEASGEAGGEEFLRMKKEQGGW